MGDFLLTQPTHLEPDRKMDNIAHFCAQNVLQAKERRDKHITHEPFLVLILRHV